MIGPLEGDCTAPSKLNQEDFGMLGESDWNDKEEDIFEDTDFAVSKDEYESLSSDSLVSSTSDISERSVEAIVDLKALFVPSLFQSLSPSLLLRKMRNLLWERYGLD